MKKASRKYGCMRQKLLFFLIFLTLAVFSALPAFGATITVMNTNDSGAGSLRDAIATAASGDTINFSVTGTITLSSTLTIGKDLTISGPGASNLAISGNNTVLVFLITSGTATISALTIENGNYSNGGGIWNQGTLSLSNSIFSGNSSGQGGGINNFGGCTLTVTDSTFSGNSASASGGGIYNFGKLTVTRSTFSGNTAVSTGGGIDNTTGGMLTVTNSTFSGNLVTGNQALGGAGIVNNATLYLTNSTFSGNSSGQSGGILNLTSGTLTVKGTLLEKGPSGNNCSNSGTITSLGYNLSDDASCVASFTQIGDLNSTSAGLDPSGLQNNGGPTQTIALLPTSAAVDAIPVSACTDVGGNPVATDQRGVARPQGSACDIGAFELVPTVPPIANAGPNQTVSVGSLVTLDGSGSSDPSGLVPLTYAWSFFSKPAGSAAVLSNPTAVNPTFTADLTGNYVVQLIVTNSAGVASTPSSVTITAYACYPNLPSPSLAVTGQEDYQLPGEPEYTRYHLGVSNWSAFPDDLFTAAPDLPACGLNTSASRTWVNIYGQDGTYIYGFCGLNSASLLENSLWFALPKGVAPPSYVYITLNDRRCQNTYTSNLASTNLKPVANAGADQTVHVGNLVTLDGSGSSDPGGNYPLTYQWAITKAPAGSSCQLSSPGTVHPSFIPDLPGDYVITLVVTDSLGLSSDPATVKVSTTNTAPVASAGPDQAVTLIGSTIQLDGSQSYDPDGDPITYQWSFVSMPAGSAAKLSNLNIVNPTFIADVHGTYVVQLIVSDPWSQSTPAMVTISFNNVAPVANAGTSQSAIVGDTVTLNGSGSSDANGDPLTYHWFFTSVPAGSASSIASPTSVITSFIPDLPGTYVVQLIVNDGFINSDPSTVQVQVITAQTEAVQQTQNIEHIIASLNPSVFKNAKLQNSLINMLNTVLADLDTGNYADALSQLISILGKTDGCATTGAPDNNDWIKTCDAQNQVYPYVMKLIQLVESLK